MSGIIDIMLNNVIKRLEEYQLKIEITDSAKKLIQKKGTDINYGARPLRRAIQNLIEDKIAEAILGGEIKEGDNVKLDANDEQIEIKVLVTNFRS